MRPTLEFYGIVAYNAAPIDGEGRYYYTERFKILYEPNRLIDGSPVVDIGSEREGGPRPTGCWLIDVWALWVIKKAKAEWFLPFMKRLAKGEKVAMWEVAREYEICEGKPMQVIPPNLTDQFNSEDYSCAQFTFPGEASLMAIQPLPVPARIRDASWRGIIGCHLQSDQWGGGDFCLAYCDRFYQDKPGVYIQRGLRGGIYSIEAAWQDEWCQEQIKLAKAEWFLPYLEYMLQGGKIGMWELHREMETRCGHPMYLLPPGIPLSNDYCRWFSVQNTLA
jgi:hypothetical protein